MELEDELSNVGENMKQLEISAEKALIREKTKRTDSCAYYKIESS